MSNAFGVIPTFRSIARFNWHRELIPGLLRHPEVSRILLPRLRSADSR